MTFTQLKYFITVCELGRIRIAAEQLHISESTISVSIKRLEEEVGTPLFTRSRKQLFLTEEGKSLRVRSAEIVESFERLETDIQRARASSHIVCIGAPSSPGEFLCSHYISPFMEKHPATLFETPPMPSVDAVSQVLDEKLELAVCDQLAVNTCKIEFAPLIRTKMMGYVRNDHPLAGKENVTAEMLRGEKLILWSEKALISKELVQWFCGSGVEPNLFMYSNRNSFSVASVRRHNAVAFFLDYLMDAKGSAATFPPEDLAPFTLAPELYFTLGIIRKKGAVISKDAQNFFSFCSRRGIK